MDIINNILFSAKNNTSTPQLTTKFFPLPNLVSNGDPVNRGTFYSYDLNVLNDFMTMDEVGYIDDAIQKHWADMVSLKNYISGGNIVSVFENGIGGVIHRIPPYHLIYAYLVENTRAPQIFQKLIEIYTQDEKLTKATGNPIAFQWILNTENLFYKNLSNKSLRNISSQARTSSDEMRRNAYFRMFGMDLAFGDTQDNPINYTKAQFNNSPFIILFEKLLREIWQGYMNANNAIGPNSTDMFAIADAASKIQEMLMSRRTTETTFENYRYFNLSKEEYASFVMMAWFYEVISYDSPLIEFLRCNGNTPGERLINIGNKVGIQAHSKSEGLLDIAGPMNTFLRRIELGEYNDQVAVRRIILSQSPVLNPLGTAAEVAALNDILSIINNWEKATGHQIKNPEANISGSVTIQQNNGIRASQNGVPKPVLN